jgi:hypothetical protein
MIHGFPDLHGQRADALFQARQCATVHSRDLGKTGHRVAHVLCRSRRRSVLSTRRWQELLCRRGPELDAAPAKAALEANLSDARKLAFCSKRWVPRRFTPAMPSCPRMRSSLLNGIQHASPVDESSMHKWEQILSADLSSNFQSPVLHG